MAKKKKKKRKEKKERKKKKKKKKNHSPGFFPFKFAIFPIKTQIYVFCLTITIGCYALCHM